jgi:recombination protein RecA
VQESKEKQKAIELAILQIEKQFGKGSIMKLGGKEAIDIAVIPSGAISIDYALGVGGMPRGRVVEIFGPESSGKTTLALHILAEAQKQKGMAAFIDAEHALDPEYSRKLGVNVSLSLITESKPLISQKSLSDQERSMSLSSIRSLPWSPGRN